MEIKEITDKIRENVSRVIVGNTAVIDRVMAALLTGGHVLLEDNPGTGKTMLAKAVAKSIEASFKRVQFTPDLMPQDITGLNIYNRRTSEFELVKGPVFTNILLADEINRATPRAQASLLEAMEEKQVTIDKETLPLMEPFMVMATENPIETTGTYPLPEAQLDRFMMKLSMERINTEGILGVIDRFIGANPMDELDGVVSVEEIMAARKEVMKIHVHTCIREYIVNIAQAADSDSRVSMGVSTRGILALVKASQAYAAMSGRKFVIPDDVRILAPDVLGHRILIFSGMNSQKGRQLVEEIVRGIEVPVEDWEN